MDRQTYEQLDRIEHKQDLILGIYYEQDDEGNLVRKGQKKDKKEESHAAE